MWKGWHEEYQYRLELSQRGMESNMTSTKMIYYPSYTISYPNLKKYCYSSSHFSPFLTYLSRRRPRSRMTQVSTTEAKNSDERFKRASIWCLRSGAKAEYGVARKEFEKALMCSSRRGGLRRAEAENNGSKKLPKVWACWKSFVNPLTYNVGESKLGIHNN